MIVHAGLSARRIGGTWRGALILGPSGAGKSDLALRATAHGLRLAADDRVLLWRSGGRLFGRAPDALAGLVEARGLGVLPAPAVRFCEIVLAVRCGPAERLPDPETETVLGIEVPLIRLAPLEPSAPVKLALAFDRLAGIS